MEIHIFWEGPFNLQQIKKLNDKAVDYGIYQVYGHHSLYGKDVLLYIGKANQQTFYTRLKQEKWNYYYDPDNIKIYVGRLASKEIDWNLQIDLSERLLIYSHSPVQNIASKNNINYEELKNLHIFNWKNYRDLFPEISWKRWSDKFDHISENDLLKMD